jgi:hypothetical protein
VTQPALLRQRWLRGVHPEPSEGRLRNKPLTACRRRRAARHARRAERDPAARRTTGIPACRPCAGQAGAGMTTGRLRLFLPPRYSARTVDNSPGLPPGISGTQGLLGAFPAPIVGAQGAPSPLRSTRALEQPLWSPRASTGLGHGAGVLRGLLAHPPQNPCIHNAGIGEDESHLSAIVPKEQIEVRADPILIHRGVGAGTVRVDRIGTGIGEMLLQESAVIAVRVDAGQRAVTVIMLLAGEGEMDLLTILKQPETSTVIHIGPFQRLQRARFGARCRLGVSRSPAEEPDGQEQPNTKVSFR